MKIIMAIIFMVQFFLWMCIAVFNISVSSQNIEVPVDKKKVMRRQKIVTNNKITLLIVG